MLNLLSYIGVSLQSELCLWTLLGLMSTIFDATLFKVNANLKQVWQMSMPPELSMPVQRGLRTMISGVMLVQCFTVYVYLASYIVLLYPVFLEERPTLVLPWLLLAAIRKFLCELTSLALGLGACVLLGPARPPCIKFVVFKLASIMPSFYMWMLVFSYYKELKVEAAFKRLPTSTAMVTQDPDYGLELAVRRRRTKSLQDEDQLRKKLVASLNYDERSAPPSPRHTNEISSRNMEDVKAELMSSIDWNQIIPNPASTERVLSVQGSTEDWFGTDFAIPRDTDRILEQFVIMLLKIGAYLKSEGETDPSKMFASCSRELRNYSNMDCSNLQTGEADTPLLVGHSRGKTISYLQEYPQIFMKKPSENVQFSDEPKLVMNHSKSALKSSQENLSESQSLFSQKSVIISDKVEKANHINFKLQSEQVTKRGKEIISLSEPITLVANTKNKTENREEDITTNTMDEQLEKSCHSIKDIDKIKQEERIDVKTDISQYKQKNSPSGTNHENQLVQCTKPNNKQYEKSYDIPENNTENKQDTEIAIKTNAFKNETVPEVKIQNKLIDEQNGNYNISNERDQKFVRDRDDASNQVNLPKNTNDKNDTIQGIKVNVATKVHSINEQAEQIKNDRNIKETENITTKTRFIKNDDQQLLKTAVENNKKIKLLSSEYEANKHTKIQSLDKIAKDMKQSIKTKENLTIECYERSNLISRYNEHTSLNLEQNTNKNDQILNEFYERDANYGIQINFKTTNVKLKDIKTENFAPDNNLEDIEQQNDIKVEDDLPTSTKYLNITNVNTNPNLEINLPNRDKLSLSEAPDIHNLPQRTDEPKETLKKQSQKSNLIEKDQIMANGSHENDSPKNSSAIKIQENNNDSPPSKCSKTSNTSYVCSCEQHEHIEDIKQEVTIMDTNLPENETIIIIDKTFANNPETPKLSVRDSKTSETQLKNEETVKIKISLIEEKDVI